MKNKKSAVSSHPPVVVALPNTTAEKMRAISTLAEAVANLSRALCSVNTNVTISNCDITTTGTAIDITSEI